MSIRTWEADQSAQIQLAAPDGAPATYPVVTQQDLCKAVLDGAVMIDRAGGCLSVVVLRVPTGIPNQMVTTRAMITWSDRTNAKPQAEASAIEQLQHEAPAGATAEPAAALEGEPLDDGLHVDPELVDESDPELRAAVGA
jgi:hypothetical protein